MEKLWAGERVEPWAPGTAADSGGEELEPRLHALIAAEWRRDSVFRTLGPNPKPNLLTEVTRSGVLVETEKSRRERGGAAEVPAWMLNLAWDQLRTHGELTNQTLLKELRVHRSSAVCAILARMPGVRARGGSGITLRWAPKEVSR